PNQFDNLAVGESELVTVTYDVTDGTTTVPNTVTITVDGRNDAPVVTAIVLEDLPEDGFLLITEAELLAGAVDVDGDDLTISNLVASSGTVNESEGGQFTFTPNFNDDTEVTFTFDVFDGQTTVKNTATLDLLPQDDISTLSPVAVEGQETDAPLTLTGEVTIDDPEGDPVTIVPQTNTEGDFGAFSVDSIGNWTFTASSSLDELNVGDFVSEVFTVFAVDGASTTVTVTINGTDDEAVAADDSFQIDDNGTLVQQNLSTDNGNGVDDVDNVSVNVSRINGATGNVGTQITLASGALLTVGANGLFDYDTNGVFEFLPVNETATDQFTYELDNGTTATVTIGINGVDNNDVLIGTSGNDTLTGGLGNDELFGGSGSDTANFSGDIGNFSFDENEIGDIVVTDQNGDNDTLIDIELLEFDNVTVASDEVELGTDGFDFIIGTSLSDAIEGFGDNDRLEGRDGDDLLNGGAGADLLLGGTGQDTLIGGDGNDLLNGQAGDDTLIGGEGTDRLTGAAGNDILNAGGGVNNVLDGGAGGDTLSGGEARDIIRGQAGPDLITGGGGNDALTGGFGPDTFVFNANDGGDVINDFEDNFDTIDLSSLETSFNALDIRVIGGDDALIDYGSGLIRLRDFDTNNLDENDFDFG
ncbi:MAG: VCBS domain-containing protein, partial [Lentilitoribacter sp.]